MGGNYIDQGYQIPWFTTKHYKTPQDIPQVAIEILTALVVGEIKIRYKGRKIFRTDKQTAKRI